ncbi:MAG: aldo/keto reductase [Lewinella sp.]|nr:aldo/keto reductase [Lewinella sp.]
MDTLILGTAMWGWTVPRDRAFALLDAFYEAGGRAVDGATNYPINRRPGDFRAAENILLQWIRTHGVTDLKVMMKIGSLNNLRTPDCNLRPSFLLFCFDEYQDKFGSNLDTMMIHWDNRDEAGPIAETLQALQAIQAAGYRVGLSGIRHPAHYADWLAKYPLSCRIQIKHNLLQTDYPRYAAFHGEKCFIAYGINAGGLKLAPDQYRTDASLAARGGDISQEPPFMMPLRQWLAKLPAQERPLPASMNHLGLLFALLHPDIGQVLIGPSRVEQLTDSLQWARLLQQYPYQDLYDQLNQLRDDAQI